MRFRRIYWVTEQLEESGKSSVVGVYTSIPDLIEIGLPVLKSATGFRVTLFELDSVEPPVATISSSDLSEVGATLKQFVASGEFTFEEVKTLEDALGA